RAVQRLDRYLRAERRLDDREVDLGEHVVALAHEALVRPDADRDVEVARAAAERARVALAGESDALPVVDPGGHVHVERALLERPSGAGARLARMVDLAARTLALGTARRADELAEQAPRHLLETPAAAAAVTRADACPRLHTVAAARPAAD